MQCADVTRAEQNTSRSWWPAGFKTPMMWSVSPSGWSGGVCDACRPPSLLLFPGPAPAVTADALNVIKTEQHSNSRAGIECLRGRRRRKWEAHLIYDLMTSWPHDHVTSWPCDLMTMWPLGVLQFSCLLYVTTTIRISLRTWGESQIFVSGDPFSLICFCSLSSTRDIFFSLLEKTLQF